MTAALEPQREPQSSNRPLWRMAWRRFQQRSLQYLLCLLGVALGVAMLVSIDLANGSAQTAFELSTDAIAGRATHQIESIAPAGIDESVYLQIRQQAGLTKTAPIVDGYVLAPDLGNQPLRLVGVDLFSEPPFRNYFASENQTVGLAGLQTFLTEPNTIVLSTDVARRYQVDLGDTLTLDLAGRLVPVRLVGKVQPESTTTQRALSSLIFTDIATAQEILQRSGHLSHIDLIAESEEDLDAIATLLPEDAKLETAAAQKNAVRQMTAAFRLNLTALSLLALVVGMFLIYNTVTFSVVQRRPLFGVLRCLGTTPRQLFTLIMGETAILGILGSVLGLGLGIVLARSIVGLITQTINDFYFVVSVQQVAIPPVLLVKGMLIGISSALLAALVPAIEAMRTSPQTILQRSSLENKVQKLLPWLFLSWVVITVIGIGLLRLKAGLVVAFAGLFAIVLGSALLTPPVTAALMKLVQPLTQSLGVLGRLAPRDIVRSLSRTSVAIAALMVAVSVIVGVSIMVGSFRVTVVQWLDQTLQADIYVTPPSTTANRVLGQLDPAVVAEMKRWPGLEDVVTYNDTDATVTAFTYGDQTLEIERSIKLISAEGDVSHGQRPYSWRQDSIDPWPALNRGEGVIVSEALLLKANLSDPPTSITIDSPQGPQTFPVLAVFYDYSSDQGTVILDNDPFIQIWGDEGIASMGLFTAPDIDLDTVVEDLRERYQGRTDVVVQSTRSLRDGSLEIFDRTFAITQALRLLAVIVAFIGVLSALMSLQLERTREIGILRATGMTPQQLWWMTLLETGLMGNVAGFLAMPLGYVLAWILIYVINVRSFGWTLQMQLNPSYFWQAWLVAIVAALLAGIYPAWRLSRVTVASAIREE
ncbi:ABC transporter permease [Acaryochloris marina]|uniref:ABC transporter, permease protein n=1 Tax=Acaryochloris marina (strain MBIC 11017) TaxID=329726 RepID=B0CF36_ACAM1|nr:ABC transporter permease [Acaryochloris marina]ABW30552.1 ABC transporter, permease protein [Acaryochloris marina MBIC11017]BDM79354.1 adhesion component ABC transporter permease [Acaryochloris marina MBIC10699]